METDTNNAAPTTVQYGNLTVKQLRVELSRRNAKVSGRKHELVERYVLFVHVFIRHELCS